MICFSLSFKYQNSIPVLKDSINMVARSGHDLNYFVDIESDAISLPSLLSLVFVCFFGVVLYFFLSPDMKKRPSKEDEKNVTYEERESMKSCCCFCRCNERYVSMVDGYKGCKCFKVDKEEDTCCCCCLIPCSCKKSNRIPPSEECCKCGRYYSTCYIKKCPEKFAELMLRLTIAISQFLYGSTSVKLKDKISYNYRCIKIGNRYFRLSFLALLPFVCSNALTIGSLAYMAMNYLVLHKTYVCNENIDCFLADNSNNTRITDCSMYEGIEVVCYTFEFRGSFVLALIGGIIKIVPPISFQLATTFYLVLLKNCHGCLKILVNVGLLFVAVLLFNIMIIVSCIKKFENFFLKSEVRVFQISATIMIFLGIFLFPWYILDHGTSLPSLKNLHQTTGYVNLRSDNEHVPIIPRHDDINVIYPPNDIVIKQADLKQVNDHTLQHRLRSYGSTNM